MILTAEIAEHAENIFFSATSAFSAVKIRLKILVERVDRKLIDYNVLW